MVTNASPSLDEMIEAVKQAIDDFVMPGVFDRKTDGRDHATALRAALAHLEASRLREDVIQAALRYREAETDGTPRMWRGKALQDLANELDAALDTLFSLPATTSEGERT